MHEQHYFGFTREPFAPDLRVEELYQTPALLATTERLLYAVRLGAVSLVTGEVGSGKSTCLRYAMSKLHPSQYKVISVIASTGSMIEMLRQICISLDVSHTINSMSKLAKIIRDLVLETAQKREVPVLVIDEANLMRLEVFAELHTLCQFEMDSKPLLPLILVGQNNLLDKLMYHTSRPLASRVIGRSHLEGLKVKDMAGYLKHHLEVAGVSEQLFSDEAILAIHQGSGGLLRRANYLAKGALIAAAAEKCRVVAAEHVRIASTEII
jgi:type II secretory pathway predicted ATPase ExeA